MIHFKHGDRAIWTPKRPRKGAFGAPWGLAPVEVEIVRGLDGEGMYVCKCVNQSDLPPRKGYSRVSINALTPLEAKP